MEKHSSLQSAYEPTQSYSHVTTSWFPTNYTILPTLPSLPFSLSFFYFSKYRLAWLGSTIYFLIFLDILHNRLFEANVKCLRRRRKHHFDVSSSRLVHNLIHFKIIIWIFKWKATSRGSYQSIMFDLLECGGTFGRILVLTMALLSAVFSAFFKN